MLFKKFLCFHSGAKCQVKLPAAAEPRTVSKQISSNNFIEYRSRRISLVLVFGGNSPGQSRISFAQLFVCPRTVVEDLEQIERQAPFPSLFS